ncbi:MAG: hypothetical protein F4X98_18490 [Gammaproteobacteria bacterium]|nr:hypothetical protein [Gammaproteobacteria bacterium]
MIEASAPGKLVVSGEYAVLAGAPALVAAVDRRVTCTLVERESGEWRFVSTGFEDDRSLPRQAVFEAAPDTVAGIARRAFHGTKATGSVSDRERLVHGRSAWLGRRRTPAHSDSEAPGTALGRYGDREAPEHLEIAIDSSPCYHRGVKLGVGSSAAMVTAVATAFGVLGGSAPRLAELYEFHADYQGGGSGLDVAAAVTGGVIRFQDRVVTPVRLPQGVHLSFVFTGTGTRTPELLSAFEAWRRQSATAQLERLAAAAREVVDCTGTADAFADALGEYADVLERLDQSARIGIFGPGHRRARELAGPLGVVYKPCGAGGGDTGVGTATDPAAIAAFERQASAAGLVVLPMAISADGVRVRTG